MKQDEAKIKGVIKSLRDGPSFDIDISLYATYVYCVRSHARGRLHMQVWNKNRPELSTKVEWLPGWPINPRLMRYEFGTLDDQKKFIDHVREYIQTMRTMAYPTHKPQWEQLILDFDLPVQDAIDSGTTTA